MSVMDEEFQDVAMVCHDVHPDGSHTSSDKGIGLGAWFPCQAPDPGGRAN